MAKQCARCGKKLSFFAKGPLCEGCQEAERAEQAEYEARQTAVRTEVGRKIRSGELPSVNLHIEDAAPVLLRAGEVVHFWDKARLYEVRSVYAGYEGGSHGVSIRILKGVSYRIGSQKGHAVYKSNWLETSQGFLIVSNQRLFLYPRPGHKAVSIPLKKILSYQRSANEIEIYKEDREKGYVFSVSNDYCGETFAACLALLLARRES